MISQRASARAHGAAPRVWARCAKGGYALATSADGRQQAWDTAVKDANAVGQFAETAVTDPGKTAGQVGDAVSSTWGHVSTAYRQAAADGHGAEFIGKAFGQGAMLVGTEFIPGDAEAEAVGALGDAGRAAEVVGDLGKAADVVGSASNAVEVAGDSSKSAELGQVAESAASRMRDMPRQLRSHQCCARGERTMRSLDGITSRSATPSGRRTI